jgi:hypothetical protein
MDKKATKQAMVSPISGTPPPVANQFGKPNGNPRHNGSWKKEDTPRFKLEQMMKLSRTDLQAVVDDEDAPFFERKLATAISKGQWKEIESMINQVYGQPNIKQDINHTGNVQFVNDIPRPKSD